MQLPEGEQSTLSTCSLPGPAPFGEVTENRLLSSCLSPNDDCLVGCTKECRADSLRAILIKQHILLQVPTNNKTNTGIAPRVTTNFSLGFLFFDRSANVIWKNFQPGESVDSGLSEWWRKSAHLTKVSRYRYICILLKHTCTTIPVTELHVDMIIIDGSTLIHSRDLLKDTKQHFTCTIKKS